MHPDGRLFLIAIPALDQYTLRVRAVDSAEIPQFSSGIINVFVNDTGCQSFDASIT